MVVALGNALRHISRLSLLTEVYTQCATVAHLETNHGIMFAASQVQHHFTLTALWSSAGMMLNRQVCFSVMCLTSTKGTTEGMH